MFSASSCVKRTALLRQLAAKFGDVPEATAERIKALESIDELDRYLERVLTADPGTGVMRHADAGYETARRIAVERGVDLPMEMGEGG